MVQPPTLYDAVDIMLVNLDKWNALPKPLQGLLTDMAAEAERQCMARAASFKQEEIARLGKLGIRTVTLPEAEAQRFLETAHNALWDTLMERDAATAKRLREMIR
jgi:TRAP-type C4-dicarboxylate transport system substrate-binding protein